MQRQLHLICNAHLDPVWLWEWQEGAAEAIGTFRTAADFCERYDGFVFNHNEAILYQWVEQYDPPLFARIRRLVKRKKWHVMGGWFLQPDCNMPSGESLVRQVLLGRTYFRRKLGVAPAVAINFDPFGHTRGLVQVLARSGYRGYLFCRPGQGRCPLAADAFIWEGYDGSRVLARRATEFYNTMPGQARAKVEAYLAAHGDEECGLVLWGMGNHGGGASRTDLQQLGRLIRRRRDVAIAHSTPEAYFRRLRRSAGGLPVHRRDINPWAPGCYTSQVRIKQKHRQLENDLYAAEKMAAAAWCQGRMDYPAEELHQAMGDLATAEFHDILPGSSIQPVEEAALRLMDHGLEVLSRVRARAFFALSGGQRKAVGGALPVLVYNPHPYPVRTTVECELQLPAPNWDDVFTSLRVRSGGRVLPAQVEKEQSNLALDWRRRVVFAAELAPSQMNRFDCLPEVLPARPAPKVRAERGAVRLRTGELEVTINTRTGLMDRYRAGGVDYVLPGSCLPLVMQDDADPWGMRVTSFRKTAGRFGLLSKRDAARLAGVRGEALAPVRVIEDGEVRTVVEALLGFGDSRLVQRYKVPKQGTEVAIETRVRWNEKDRMLKLAIATPDQEAICRGQVAYGCDVLPGDGTETVAQKWAAVVSPRRRTALTCINDGSYGLDFRRGELRLSLLRSPAYSAHPIGERPLVPRDRYTPRIDQGERVFRFWLNAGPAGRRLSAIDREALAHNERPMALSFFPSGGGDRRKPKPLVTLSDGAVQLTAAKRAERGRWLIVRLFEPTGRRRSTVVSLPFARMRKRVTLGAFEIRTYRIDLRKRTWREVDLLER